MNGLHVAIIMDGNGRWATARGLPRLKGHHAGADAVRRIVKAAPGLGIHVLTLYAFSSDNWRRPSSEVAALMGLLETHLRAEALECAENGIRINVIGSRDRLPRSIVSAIAAAEKITAAGRCLLLRIAVDYSARNSILLAARRLAGPAAPSREDFEHHLAEAQHSALPVPDVDLLLRTGGEQRLSDFLLWECAYAELLFVPTMWPDFDDASLESAIAEFRRRERRFGGLPAIA